MWIAISSVLVYLLAAGSRASESCAVDDDGCGVAADVMLQHRSATEQAAAAAEVEEEEEGVYDPEESEPDPPMESAPPPEETYKACRGKSGVHLMKCMDMIDNVIVHEDAPEVAAKPKTEHDKDVMAESHMGDPFDEAIITQGAFEIYGVDGVENVNNQCFVKNQGVTGMNTPDNIENTVKNAQGQLNNDGTNRGDWAKCLPPPMYTMLTVGGFEEGAIKQGQFEKDLKNATDFYTLMKFAHNEACTHIRLDVSEPALTAELRDEINHVSPPGLGKKIAAEIEKVVGQLVKQYTSLGEDNPENKAAMAALEAAVNGRNRAAVRTALTIIQNSRLVTPRDVDGSSARRLFNDLYTQSTRNVNDMARTLQRIKQWLAARPKLENYLADTKKKQGTNAANGADGYSDVLQNFGMCGARQRNIRDQNMNNMHTRFTAVTLKLSLDKGGVKIQTKEGFKTGAEIVAETAGKPVNDILPDGAVVYPEGKKTYQDDLFSQGNVACKGTRDDGAWTMTTADRNNNGQNTARGTQEEGYFCIWVLEDMQNLPADQRGGFSNTELVAESPEVMAKVLGGKPEYYTGFFTKEYEKYKYFHCHYAPQNSGAFRVYSFQHQAERNYPGSVRQVCSCDWRKMGMLVSRCDCTLDAQANGGCRRVEMQALNENTQLDLWVNKGAPSTVALKHGDLAEGRIQSYDYTRDNRPDNTQIFQEATGRVRPTTNGNGGNNVVCATDQNGVPNNANVRTYIRPRVATSKSAQGDTITWFTDFDDDGELDFEGSSADPKTKGKEFRLKDIAAKEAGGVTSVPAGGDNLEFVSAKGACDALRMSPDCRAADAGNRKGVALTEYLAQFCGTSASLYAVPILKNKDGKGVRVVPGFSNPQGLLPALDFPPGNYIANARASSAMMPGPFLIPGAQGGGARAPKPPNPLTRIFSNADLNRDGKISRKEFDGVKVQGAALAQIQGEVASAFEAPSAPAFERLDLNYDGVITLAELERSHRRPMLFATGAQLHLSQAAGVETPPNAQYYATGQAYGVGGTTKYTLVTIQASNDAYIGLFPRRLGVARIARNNFYEILLGGNRNTRQYIRRDGRQLAVVVKNGLISADEPRDFWISLDSENGRIAVGKGRDFNRGEIVIEAVDTQEIKKNPIGVGVMSAGGATGKWTFPPIAGADAALDAQQEEAQEDRGDWSMDAPAVQAIVGAGHASAGGASADARGPALEVNIGGSTRDRPSAVPTKWLDKGQKAFGVLEKSFQDRAPNSQTKGAKYLRDLISSEEGRADGITCLNGKYVWAKRSKDGSRPVVSTVREGFNVRGPAADTGAWACRYMGVHCNTNNCNNNAQTEVADTYVDGNGDAILKRSVNPPAPTRRRRRR